MELSRIGFIGAGNMASAIIAAILQNQLWKPEDITLSDPDEVRLAPFLAQGMRSASNRETVETCPLVVLAVKPQIMDNVLRGIAPVSSGRCFLSIAAGISTGFIGERLSGAQVLRVMPNTPMMVSMGATVIADTPVPEELRQAAVAIFGGAGETAFLPENLMAEIIGVSGSSPAYFFRFIGAMVEAAQAQGLDPALSLRLAVQSMEGAAAMLKQTGKSPAELTAQVASPGGTTRAALDVFDAGGFEDMIQKAMLACTKRAYELGR